MEKVDPIEEIQKILQIQFYNKSLLEKALSHASGCQKSLSNERLEFLGDSIVGMVVTEYLYHRFPDFQEGRLTKIKSAIVSRKIMAQITQELGLARYCKFGTSMAHKKSIPSSVLANIFESVVGAIYLDQGYEVVKNFLITLLAKKVEHFQHQENIEDYKSLLQNYCQKNMGCTPRYKVLSERGPEHEKVFTVAVQLGEKELEKGEGRSKKKAEQAAAKATFLFFQNSPPPKEVLSKKHIEKNKADKQEVLIKEKEKTLTSFIKEKNKGKRENLFFSLLQKIFPNKQRIKK